MKSRLIVIAWVLFMMPYTSIAQEQPKEERVSYVIYQKDDGSTYCALATSGLNWTEVVKEKGTPAIISDVVGKAGVGATEEAAKANLTTVRTKKDSLGKTLVYIDQEKPFKDNKVFYLDLSYKEGVQISRETLKKVKFITGK